MTRRFINKCVIGLLAVLSFAAVVTVVLYYEYCRVRQNETEIKSQYTFDVRLNEAFEVVGGGAQEQDYDGTAVSSDWVDTASLVDISRIWITEYLGQMQGKYVPNVKAIKNISIDGVNVINANDNTVLIGFSAEALNKESDYFNSWEGYVSDGRMICEWVVRFNIENMYDGTARVRPVSVQMPEEYGIETYTSNGLPVSVTAEAAKEPSEGLYRYQLSDGKIQVTFDGGERWTVVPAESSYLLHSYLNKDDNTVESQRIVDEGTYFIDSQNAAFLYGGVTINGKPVPLTLIYTNDEGEHWVSSQVSDITNVNFVYMTFFSESNGVIVAGYTRSQNTQASVILRTTDGGENWTAVGSTPLAREITGALFIDEKTGFISYKYDGEAAGTLFATFDGGASFSQVILEEQQLSDNLGGAYQWSSVYVQAQTPTMDQSGTLSLIVTQQQDSTYNNPTLAARYISEDRGRTWKYVEQVDMKK